MCHFSRKYGYGMMRRKNLRAGMASRSGCRGSEKVRAQLPQIRPRRAPATRAPAAAAAAASAARSPPSRHRCETRS